MLFRTSSENNKQEVTRRAGGIKETYQVAGKKKKHILLEIMKCIHKFTNLKNAGFTDNSQLLTS